MTAPKIYRWDDDNAPVASGQAGSGIALLRACLVDGYGDKQPAGWSMPYSNSEGTLAAFRNNPETGTGFYLQANNPDRAAALRGYENMTDEATGVKPFSSRQISLYTSSKGETTPRPWLLVADDRFFVAVIWQHMTIAAFAATLNDRAAIQSGGYAAIAMFGDCIPLFDSDNYFCVHFGNDGDRVTSAILTLQPDFALSGSSSSVHYKTQYVARNIEGLDAETLCQLITGGGPLCLGNEGVTHHENLPTRTPGHEIVSRPYVNNGAPYSMRGYVPGLWHSCHKYTELDQFEVIELGGHRFMVVKCAGATDYRNHILVDISEHWRP